MNTDITASTKPEYPVVDRNPPFTKTVANFNTLDYLRFITITGISVTVGYLSGIKPNIRGPSMVTGGLIGLMGGFMYAYQNSAGRLMGFFPNEDEVARYKAKHQRPIDGDRGSDRAHGRFYVRIPELCWEAHGVLPH